MRHQGKQFHQQQTGTTCLTRPVVDNSTCVCYQPVVSGLLGHHTHILHLLLHITLGKSLCHQFHACIYCWQSSGQSDQKVLSDVTQKLKTKLFS